MQQMVQHFPNRVKDQRQYNKASSWRTKQQTHTFAKNDAWQTTAGHSQQSQSIPPSPYLEATAKLIHLNYDNDIDRPV